MVDQVKERKYAEYAYDDEDPRGERRVNLIKWSLGCAGLGMLLFTGMTMLLLIVTPIWFRSLPTSEQVIWMNRLPLLEAFRPTRVYSSDNLPTAISNESEALALLQTPGGPADTTVVTGGLDAGDDAESMPVNTPTLAPTRLTPAPTSVLATNTPVLAPLIATPTAVPTRVAAIQPTATATPTIPPPPVPTELPAPPAFQSVGYRFVKQGWNTCGPANLTQALYYLGWNGSKENVVDYLKPNTEDRNVSPWEMVNYVNEYLNKQQGFPVKAIMRYGGDLNLIKRLVANRFAVIIEKGYFVAGEGWMGHYLTIQGYDDARSQIHGLDTYLGDRWEKYSELDMRWQQFNRVFLVLYPEERERELVTVLGPYHDVNYGYKAALSTAKYEASTQPDNAYAWFNMGTSYVLLGDYKNAVTAFDAARSDRVREPLPWRMMWYQFTPYEAYYNARQYSEVLSLADAMLNTSADLEKSHYWRGMALAAQGNLAEAERAFNKALAINNKFYPAADRLAEVRSGRFRAPNG